MIRKQRFLGIFALIISLIFCAELIIHGIANFNFAFNPIENQANFDKRYIQRGIEYLFLVIIYIVWLIENKRQRKSYDFREILKSASIFLLIAFIGYPVSSDIFLYLHYGLMDLNSINPFINAAGSFKSELSPLFVWSQTSTYGPVSQLFFLLSAYFTSVSIVLGVYVFKLFCLVGHIVNGYLIGQQLKSSKHQSKITLAYLVNPLILFEQVTNAHLDVFICTVLIALIICIRQHRYVATVLVTWIGFLTKTIPIIWLPMLFVFLIKKKLWKSLMIASILSLAIAFILSLTVFPTGKSWLSILNSGVVWQTAGSLHNILSFILEKTAHLLPNPANNPNRIKNVTTIGFKMLTYLIFVIYYAWTLFKAYFRKGYSTTNLVLDIGWATLVLFLFATPWYQPWYCSILLPIVALYPSSWFFALTTLTFCISSICSYHLLAYPNAPGEIFLLVSIITVVPPIVVLLLKAKLLQAMPHIGTVKQFQ